MKVELYGLRLPEVRPRDDLAKMVADAASKEAGGIKDGDILVITSKVVSKAYGFLIRLDDVKPSKRALRIAGKTGGDPCFIQAVLDNSDEVLFILPFAKLVEKDVIRIERMSRNIAGAYEAIKRIPYILIVRRGGQIYSDAGLDFSNHPEGVMSVPPENMDEYAREIRRRILELTGRRIAVIITDTEMWISFGSLDFARGSSGIEVIHKGFGNLDLYGKPKFGGVDCIAHEIACASALLMGQTDEGIPAVIVRGYKYVESEESISDYQLSGNAMRLAVKEIIKSSINILGFKWLFKFFIR
ncbi:coenzyme F420-0:L-glutamate ligase [Candidatus Bathyarchaeota archaeon]|nr:MAG: coenzyme F420-0:L-glutamate ligase [Candidatus Bathyarchaeota archaeon]